MVDDIQDGLPAVHDGSDNVFADLGLPDADENELEQKRIELQHALDDLVEKGKAWAEDKHSD